MADKVNKLSIGGKLSKWFRETRSELKKVVWPNFKQIRNNTAIVIAAVLIVGVVIAGFDYAATTAVMKLILGSLKKAVVGG